MTRNESFIDEVTIDVAAGDGGDGSAHMRREKFVPRGGPDGGDGGRGGDVVLAADRNLATLVDPAYRRRVRAEDGAPGGTSTRNGSDGRSLLLRVPVGTVVYDADADRPALADLSGDGDRYVAARGGRGGRGNTHFKTATHQAPDRAERGRPGGHARLRLSLKLLADVGLVGFPNAGKSTLLRRISRARPRVADYPFTTLIPTLGVAEVDERRFVVADLPGLIEGASDGAGLGDRFLRHVERTRVLVHVIDGGALALESSDLLERYDAIRAELGCYDASLLDRTELIALNKVDLVADREILDGIEARLRARGPDVHRISGATGEGVDGLVAAMARELHDQDARDREAEGAA